MLDVRSNAGNVQDYESKKISVGYRMGS